MIGSLRISARVSFSRCSTSIAAARVDELVAVTVLDDRAGLLAGEQLGDLLVALLGHDPRLVADVLLEAIDLVLLDLESASVLLDALAREDLDVDDGAVDARRRLQARVTHVAGLLTEDGSQQLLLGGQLRLALRRDLADQDVAGLDAGTDANDAALVEILERRLRDVRDVARDLFGAELRVASLDLELLDVDRGVGVFLDELLGDQDGVLEVVAAPRHEGDEHVAAESELAVLGRRTVGQNVALLDTLPFVADGLLVNAGVLVRAAELGQLVDVSAELLVSPVAISFHTFDTNDDAIGVDRVDDTGALAEHDGTGVAGDLALETGADDRRVRLEKRNGLALHVGAHERAVRVVVLEERDERCGDRNELLRVDVHVIDALALDADEVATGASGRDARSAGCRLLVHAGVGLRDDVLLLFPGGQVEGVRLTDHLALLPAFLRERFVLSSSSRVMTSPSLYGPSPMRDDHAGDRARDPLDLLVRTLDEAVVVDARVGRQRRDETDVRTFRSLDRADATVVRGVHIANLEAGALTRQAARSESRETTLVRDLGKRVRLVHELRELRRTEELLDRRDDRLRVDEVVRHRRVDVLVHGHLLLDGSLHADQADAELVLEKLTDGTHAAVAEVVDVVDAADVLLQVQEVLDDAVEVLRGEGLLVDGDFGVELDVELEATHRREVVALRVEEHAVEERACALERRRITGAHAAVDLDERVLGVLGGVLGERRRQDRAAEVPVREEELEVGDLTTAEALLEILGHRIVGLEDDLTRLQIDDVGDGVKRGRCRRDRG